MITMPPCISVVTYCLYRIQPPKPPLHPIRISLYFSKSIRLILAAFSNSTVHIQTLLLFPLFAFSLVYLFHVSTSSYSGTETRAEDVILLDPKSLDPLQG